MALRVDIKQILRTPSLRRAMVIDVIVATQAREDITTTREQAAAAYDRITKPERHSKKKLDTR